MFGGGAGGGVSVQPLGFLVIKDGAVSLLQMDNSKNTADRMVSLMPEMIDKLGTMFKKDKKESKDSKDSVPTEEKGTR
jgi:uncharacterized spore protein YtfJ